MSTRPGVVESVVIVDETQTMYDLDVETVDTFAVEPHPKQRQMGARTHQKNAPLTPQQG